MIPDIVLPTRYIQLIFGKLQMTDTKVVKGIGGDLSLETPLDLLGVA